ncbi:MAG: hypothetical protein AAF610_02965 [Pseudomonadota bacterium]
MTKQRSPHSNVQRVRVSYAIYGAVAALLIGVLIGRTGSPPAAAPAYLAPQNSHASHGHGTHEVDSDRAPQVTLSAVDDAISGINLYLDTVNFDFDAHQVNSAVVMNEGHAHLYVDGVKHARLYAPYFHLAGLSPGPHELTVALLAHDHYAFALKGVPISDSITVVVEAGASQAGDAGAPDG